MRKSSTQCMQKEPRQSGYSSHYEKFTATGEVRCIDDEIPFDIPDTWEWVRIRDISQSYIGLTYAPTDVKNEGIIVLRSSNIRNGKLDLTDIVRVNKEINEKLLVGVHDIIICARNGSKKLVGKSALITEMLEPMTFGAFMAICKTPLYDYIYLFLQSDLFFSQLRKVSGTTTINQLTQNNFNGFIIPIPPKEEQERIITKCNELFPIIEKYGVAQNKLDTLNSEIKSILKKSILQEAIQGRLVEQCETDEPVSKLLERIQEEKRQLVKQGKLKAKDLTNSTIFRSDDNKYYEQIGDKCVEITEEIPFEIPNSWAWCRIGDIATIKGGKRLPIGETFSDIPTPHIYIRVTEMKNNTLVPNGLKFISEKVFQQIQNYTISSNDLYLTIAGTIGNAGIVPPEFNNMNLTENAVKLTDIQINKKYLLNSVLSNYVQNLFAQRTNKVGQPKLAIERIKRILIPIPPLAEQKRIVERIEELYSRL